MRFVSALGRCGLVGVVAWFLYQVMASAEPRVISQAKQSSAPEVFWTWETLEPDTVASAWLLTRFGPPGATIQLVPRGKRASYGRAFDVPLAELSRTHDRSTFHVICDAFGLEDEGLKTLAALVDEIEIRSWHDTTSREGRALERSLRQILGGSDPPQAALAKGMNWLDREHPIHREIRQ